MSAMMRWSVAGALLLGSPVAAQAADDDAIVTELVVAARKREERLHDVPAAGSVLTGERIQESSNVLNQHHEFFYGTGFLAAKPGPAYVLQFRSQF